MLGLEHERITVSLRNCPAPDLTVGRNDPLLDRIDRSLDRTRVFTGEESFDARVLVRAADEKAAASYLSPPRRRALLKIVERTDAESAGIQQGRLYLDRRRVDWDSDRLSHDIRLLLQAAPALDGDKGTGV